MMTDTSFDTTESVVIAATPQRVWEHLTNFRNYESAEYGHGPVRLLTDDPAIHPGLEWEETEKIGPTHSVFHGKVIDVADGRGYTWEGTAKYSVLGPSVTIRQGGTFTIEPQGSETRLAHRVWTEFPETMRGRIAEWAADHVLNMPAVATRYIRAQLEHFKKNIESKR
jgi:uncharacterized protein YndB with AHSA1/START domain